MTNKRKRQRRAQQHAKRKAQKNAKCKAIKSIPILIYTLPNLPLDTNRERENELYATHKALHRLHNALVNHANKGLKILDNDAEYIKSKRKIVTLKAELAKETSKKRKRDSKKIKRLKAHIDTAKKYCSEATEKLGLTKRAFEIYAMNWRNSKYTQLTDCESARKESEDVWEGVAEVLYGSGKHLHYQRWDDNHAINGKKADAGNIVKFDKLGRPIGVARSKKLIPFKRPLNDYETEALTTGEIRYTDIYPIQFSDGYHWYARIVIRGRVPQKGRKKTTVRGGLDVGTSTAAFACRTLAEMRVLGGETSSYDAKIEDLNRRIDESIRTTNPDYYNENGTIKRRVRVNGKLPPRKWQISYHCRRMKVARRVLYRKEAMTIRQAHFELANVIASHASVVYTEVMNWASLAKKGKRSMNEETGREKSRKRFGKSIQSHAPAEFLDVLSWRLSTMGGQLNYVNTYTYRASQLNHATGECAKTKLSCRTKKIEGEKVQRDLYSAFLLWHSEPDGKHASTSWCKRDWRVFVAKEREFRKRAVEVRLPRNSCFGF